MKCPQCGAKNARQNRFCARCGTALPVPKKASPLQAGCGCLVLIVIVLAIAAAIANSQTGGSSSSSGSSSGGSSSSDVSPADTPVVIPTSSPSDFALLASQDTYADVNDHPDLHEGDKVIWQCIIAKFLGTDSDDPLSTDVGCWMGAYSSDEIIMKVPFTIDTGEMHSGDAVTVYGTVTQPMQGTNGFGAQGTWPQIVTTYLYDRALGTPAPLLPTSLPGAGMQGGD